MRSDPAINRFIISRKLFFLFSLLLFIPFLVRSQIISDKQLEKLSPVLKAEFKSKSSQQAYVFFLVVKNIQSVKSFLEQPENTAQIIYEYNPSNVLVVKMKWGDVLQKILPHEEVVFIDEQRIPKEESAVSDLDLSANKVNVIHNQFPLTNGNGITVSVKENRPDTGDIDFKGRYLSTTLSSSVLSSHATTIASIIGGGGNSYYEGKGVGWGSTISSSNFAILLPEPDAVYQQYNISVQNHSYGTTIENFYGADAASYDASVITRPSLIHIFSAGNSGTQASSTGLYAGITGFANLTGSFKMAKNIITVGHTDSTGNVLAPSSRGPAYDGRVKPEMVAFAEDGSSGAAAIVSGISLTLQQAYKDLYGTLPSSALIKAILLNSADDTGPKGIDFTSGYGTANAYKAMLCVANARHFNGSINNGGSDNYNLTVPSNIKQLKITLAWDDPPAAANTTTALKNDLDLELSLPVTSQQWKPWVLNSFPDVDSLQLLPVRKRDSLNNVEQITLDNPAAGNYIINVKGYNVTTSPPQTYYIAYQLDTADKYNWFYPAKSDNIFGGRANIIRWESAYSNTTGQLEYSINNGNTWQLIDNAVDLTKGYYRWAPPDTFVTALLRMNFATQNFRTDTFTISKRFDVFVGFNCPDSFLLYWHKIPGISSYQLYKLGNKYMEPLSVLNDTSVILAKLSNPSLVYAVAPIINNKTGVRSYGYDYTAQGVACYIKTFLVQLINNTGKLDLLLGTLYNIKKISWEKQVSLGYISLQTINSFSGLQYSYTDLTLKQGLNTYRVKIELNNSQIIYSNPETIYYFNNRNYIVYPNPAQRDQPVQIMSNDLSNPVIQIFSSDGSKVYESTLPNVVNSIPGYLLSKGAYFLRITSISNGSTVLKLVID